MFGPIGAFRPERSAVVSAFKEPALTRRGKKIVLKFLGVWPSLVVMWAEMGAHSHIFPLVQPLAVLHRQLVSVTVNERTRRIAELQSNARQKPLATGAHLAVHIDFKRLASERTAVLPCQSQQECCLSM